MMYYSWLEDKEWILSLAYLHDVFEQLNKLNLRMQGKDTNIVIFVDVLRAFKSKLANWKRKVQLYNYTMFEKLNILLDERPEGMPNHIKKEFWNIFQLLKASWRGIFLKSLMKILTL